MFRHCSFFGSAFALIAGSLFFQSAQAGILTGSFNTVSTGSNVNLTAAGPIDWVHWGLYTESSLDRKDGVVSEISDFSLLDSSNGYAYVYQYGDNYNGYSWNDGTPTVSENDTTTGVWAYGVPALGSGFAFTVPAGTNARMLKVFVGAFAAGGEFEASLSDNSASPYLAAPPVNLRNGPGWVFSIAFAANSPDQTLTVKWRLVATRAADGNVTLQAAALSAMGANNPPLVVLTNPLNYASFPAPANISIGAKASDVDGEVSTVEFFEGTAKIGEATNSPYTLSWDKVAPGHYFLSAVATDNGGETSSSQSVEVFSYGTGGTLTGAVALPPIAVNLTAEGTADWAHWGLNTNSTFNHKAGVSRKITDLTAIGSRPVERYSDNRTAFSWSDGTPTATANGASNGVFITGVGNGFIIGAPADTNLRRLKVYVGCYSAEAIFQAYLSDFSARPYSDMTLSNFFGNSYAVYTLDYAAASAGQQLIVTVRSTKLFDFDFGNVTLQAATLEGGPPEPLPVNIMNPKVGGGEFVFSFATQLGFSYWVQYTPSLAPMDWTPLTNFPGTGATVSVTNQDVTESQRFYRVQTQ